MTEGYKVFYLIIAGIAGMAICNSDRKLNGLVEDVKEMKQSVADFREMTPSQFTLDSKFNDIMLKLPELKQTNVIGDTIPEQFYEIGGQRAYISIDGKAVSEYVPVILEK